MSHAHCPKLWIAFSLSFFFLVIFLLAATVPYTTELLSWGRSSVAWAIVRRRHALHFLGAGERGLGAAPSWNLVFWKVSFHNLRSIKLCCLWLDADTDSVLNSTFHLLLLGFCKDLFPCYVTAPYVIFIFPPGKHGMEKKKESICLQGYYSKKY